MKSRPRHAPALLLSAIAACAALGLAASPAAAAPLTTTAGSAAGAATSLSELSDAEQLAVKQLGGDPARAKALGLNAQATEDPAFYTPPATLPAKNGTVIRKESATFYIDPLKALKIQGKAERILYRSTDAKGKAIAVSGTVLTPTAAWKGAGDRPIIGYTVGTQGMADRCAPSRQMAVGTEYESLFLSAYLKKGYSVAITDYEGLGTPGTHTYVVSNSAAHSALDVVRAARSLKAGGVSDKSKIVLTGYSQGGNGAAAAAEHAPSYAPELPIVGAAAGAVPADLVDVAAKIDGSLYSSFLLYSLNGITTSEGLNQADFLNAKGLKAAADANESCLAGGILNHSFVNSATLTQTGEKFSTIIKTNPTLKQGVANQKLGMGRKPAVPTLLSHSYLDDVIPYSNSKELAQRWCAQGAKVSLRGLVTPTHVGGAVASVPFAMDFIEKSLAGKKISGTC